MGHAPAGEAIGMSAIAVRPATPADMSDDGPQSAPAAERVMSAVPPPRPPPPHPPANYGPPGGAPANTVTVPHPAAPVVNAYSPPSVPATNVAAPPAPAPVTSSYSPPGVTQTNTVPRPAPVTHNTSPPGVADTGTATDMGTSADAYTGTGVDTGGYGPPILTPAGAKPHTPPSAPQNANSPDYSGSVRTVPDTPAQ
ncbi:hypothetical protein C7401_14725 [Paraburkholderia unamae]|nr:hypothetical protein C7401_14725 [Paraburkholderia unamae]